jgi:hypothetical protein
MMLLPDAVVETASLRANATYTRYRRIDQASYEYAEAAVPDAIVRLACEVTARPLRVISSRLLRLVPGDYTLAHHGYIEEPAVELVLDVSPAAVPDAAVHYRRRGNVVFAMPSQPGALAVVERGPTITSNHTYVSKRYPGVEVVRLVALLRE